MPGYTWATEQDPYALDTRTRPSLPGSVAQYAHTLQGVRQFHATHRTLAGRSTRWLRGAGKASGRALLWQFNGCQCCKQRTCDQANRG